MCFLPKVKAERDSDVINDLESGSDKCNCNCKYHVLYIMLVIVVNSSRFFMLCAHTVKTEVKIIRHRKDVPAFKNPHAN